VRILIFIFLSFVFLFSCSSYNKSENLDIENGKLAHSKFVNMNNDFLYDEYKSLVIKYGKNSKYPDINKQDE